MKTLILLLVLIFVNTSCGEIDSNFIRVNQIGYLKKDIKRAIVGADHNLQGQKFFIRNQGNNKIIFSDYIETAVEGDQEQSPFAFNHIIDFSPVETKGFYRIELTDNTVSPSFQIADDVYRSVIDTLLFFLRSARCGNTNPEMHKPCHLYDATNTDIDLTGGWHDAGDFLKFTRSESYTTYTLLLSYEINKKNHSDFFSDLDNNGMIDILDEAQIGLDYLLKIYPDPKTFVLRVGAFDADHSQGPRMPEDDKLAKTNRPALFGFKRNELGKYAFTMALASSVFRDFAGYSDIADRYLKLAKRAYFEAKRVGKGEFDKLCLAATELYRATSMDIYLKEAIIFNDQLSSGHWGNYSDQTNLAHARLADFYKRSGEKLKHSVIRFTNASRNHLFGYNVQYAWSGLYVVIGSGSTGWFYQLLFNDSSYEDLALRVRDYTLGLNPWGICFISGLGTYYPQYIHHNITVSKAKAGTHKDGTITGAIPGGPVKRIEWEKRWKRKRLLPKSEDIYSKFQTKEAVYFDHFRTYPTNEPCIYGSSEAILFFSFYLRYL